MFNLNQTRAYPSFYQTWDQARQKVSSKLLNKVNKTTKRNLCSRLETLFLLRGLQDIKTLGSICRIIEPSKVNYH